MSDVYCSLPLAVYNMYVVATGNRESLSVRYNVIVTAQPQPQPQPKHNKKLGETR